MCAAVEGGSGGGGYAHGLKFCQSMCCFHTASPFSCHYHSPPPPNSARLGPRCCSPSPAQLQSAQWRDPICGEGRSEGIETARFLWVCISLCLGCCWIYPASRRHPHILTAGNTAWASARRRAELPFCVLQMAHATASVLPVSCQVEEGKIPACCLFTQPRAMKLRAQETWALLKAIS